MKEIIVYTKEDLLWGNGWLKEETETHFLILSCPNDRTTIQFPKKLFSFVYLTGSVNVL